MDRYLYFHILKKREKEKKMSIEHWKVKFIIKMNGKKKTKKNETF